MNQRFRQRILISFITALIINSILFGLVSLLSRERPRILDLVTTVPVNIVQLPGVERPAEEVVREVQQPEPEPVAKIVPDLARPEISKPDYSALNLAIDPQIIHKPGLSGDFVFNAGELDQPPRQVDPNRKWPESPRAKRMDIEGFVRVRYLVDENGTVGQITILEASPSGFFERTVEMFLPTLKYFPGKIGSRAVPAWVENTIRFEFER